MALITCANAGLICGIEQPCVMARAVLCVSPRRRRAAISSVRAVLLVALAFGAGLAGIARAQSAPTASRTGDLQIGGGFVLAESHYNSVPLTLIGGGGYFTFDWRTHWGFEGEFHQTRANQDTSIYQRTYEVGPRVFLTRGALRPYAKVMYGRGVYNFHNGVANIAYNMYTYGGGADLQMTRWLNVRADYELQNWMNFPLGTLHPSVVTIGVAYHFSSRGAPDFPR